MGRLKLGNNATLQAIAPLIDRPGPVRHDRSGRGCRARLKTSLSANNRTQTGPQPSCLDGPGCIQDQDGASGSKDRQRSPTRQEGCSPGDEIIVIPAKWMIIAATQVRQATWVICRTITPSLTGDESQLEREIPPPVVPLHQPAPTSRYSP